jgi:hypothetical protein
VTSLGGPGLSLGLLLVLGACIPESTAVRVSCRVGLVLWLGASAFFVFFTGQWAVLMIPGFVLLAWAVISDITRESHDTADGGEEDEDTRGPDSGAGGNRQITLAASGPVP